MPSHYDNTASADSFQNYLTSPDGQIERDLLYQAVSRQLPSDKNEKILDAACGQGWLSAKLYQDGYTDLAAFDASRPLIDAAKINLPQIDFQVADITQRLPYEKSFFDVCVLNMAAHDIENLNAAFINLNQVLKNRGKLIITITNPYYAFPVGVWKRGLWRALFGLKPKLRLRSYFKFTRQGKKLRTWKGAVSSYFYPLPDYINTALANGFVLTHLEELQSDNESQNFDTNYRFWRFPLILLMAFEKRIE